MNTEDLPCSKCGLEPRYTDSSWGRNCINEARRTRRAKSAEARAIDNAARIIRHEQEKLQTMIRQNAKILKNTT